MNFFRIPNLLSRIFLTYGIAKTKTLLLKACNKQDKSRFAFHFSCGIRDEKMFGSGIRGEKMAGSGSGIKKNPGSATLVSLVYSIPVP
jgi:hypothetical protein